MKTKQSINIELMMPAIVKYSVISGNVLCASSAEKVFINVIGRYIKKGRDIRPKIVKKFRNPRYRLLVIAFHIGVFDITIIGTVNIRNACNTIFVKKSSNVRTTW